MKMNERNKQNGGKERQNQKVGELNVKKNQRKKHKEREG